MSFAGFFAVVSRMMSVACSGMSVVCGLLVMATLVVLSRFIVMFRGVSMVFSGMLVVFSCFRRHASVSHWLSSPYAGLSRFSDCRVTLCGSVLGTASSNQPWAHRYIAPLSGDITETNHIANSK